MSGAAAVDIPMRDTPPHTYRIERKRLAVRWCIARALPRIVNVRITHNNQFRSLIKTKISLVWFLVDYK